MGTEPDTVREAALSRLDWCRRFDGCRVDDALVARPTVHAAGTTLGELRRFFCDDRVHMALVVDGPLLVAAVERDDLRCALPDDAPARCVGTLAGRAVPRGTPLPEVFDRMRSCGRRRLAVVDEHGVLVGLLCLKASGTGFCSDEDVASRRSARRASERRTVLSAAR